MWKNIPWVKVLYIFVVFLKAHSFFHSRGCLVFACAYSQLALHIRTDKSVGFSSALRFFGSESTMLKLIFDNGIAVSAWKVVQKSARHQFMAFFITLGAKPPKGKMSENGRETMLRLWSVCNDVKRMCSVINSEISYRLKRLDSKRKNLCTVGLTISKESYSTHEELHAQWLC